MPAENRGGAVTGRNSWPHPLGKKGKPARRALLLLPPGVAESSYAEGDQGQGAGFRNRATHIAVTHGPSIVSVALVVVTLIAGDHPKVPSIGGSIRILRVIKARPID